jgi:hypothetical protein
MQLIIYITSETYWFIVKIAFHVIIFLSLFVVNKYVQGFEDNMKVISSLFFTQAIGNSFVIVVYKLDSTPYTRETALSTALIFNMTLALLTVICVRKLHIEYEKLKQPIV